MTEEAKRAETCEDSRLSGPNNIPLVLRCQQRIAYPANCLPVSEVLVLSALPQNPKIAVGCGQDIPIFNPACFINVQCFGN